MHETVEQIERQLYWGMTFVSTPWAVGEHLVGIDLVETGREHLRVSRASPPPPSHEKWAYSSGTELM